MPGGKAPRKKGDRFERGVRKALEARGYFCVRQGRSAFPDLVAIAKTGKIPVVYFIECKLNKYLSGDEKGKLMNLEKDYSVIPVIAYKGKDRKFHFCDIRYKDIKLIW